MPVPHSFQSSCAGGGAPLLCCMEGARVPLKIRRHWMAQLGGSLPLIKLRHGRNSFSRDELKSSRDRKAYCCAFARILRTTVASWSAADKRPPGSANELPQAGPHKDEFVATLAHELLHPLVPLKNGLSVLRLRANDPAVVLQTVAMMERQVSQMGFLIHEMLDITRLGAGKLVLQKEWVDMKTVIANAIETSSPWMEAAQHALRVKLPEQALVLHADPQRMAQVVVNLLNNAAKYTPVGGLIEVSACQEGQAVVVTVTDNGVGIAQESLAGVFEMFGQVAHTSGRAQGGLGIGLSLVRQLVGMHGGTASAASAGPGQGCTFTLRLPQERPGPAQAIAGGAKGLRMLVVDDHVDAAQTLAILLALNGHTTAVAHDGFQALEKAREFRPEIVFLDIGMPGMDGYETARALRALAGLERVILVDLTGWSDQESRKRSHKTGFDHHLSKPTDLAAIQRLLPQIV